MKKKLPSAYPSVASAKIIRLHENDRRSAAFHADGKGSGHMSDSETTSDHKAIEKWAEERDGHPATVRATEEDRHAGILRIDFGPREDRLEAIDWDEFFRKFDESDLAFLHQDRTKDGKLSRFHKFVRRSAA
jgi:hypothetical protein